MLTIEESKFTFHYVSILISVSFNKIPKNKIIYIPLCLYFNQHREQKHRGLEHIYIPLCLYFNRYQQGDKANREQFTFHYVSILMKLQNALLQGVLHLHSIMSLF